MNPPTMGSPGEDQENQKRAMAAWQNGIMDMVLLRLNADRIRSRLVDEILCFDKCLKKILIMAQAFTVSHDLIEHLTTLKLVNDDKIITATVCQFLEATNAIVRFLEFQEKETGLVAGGDIWLSNKVGYSRTLVQAFLTALVSLRKGDDRPGMAFSMRYRVDIRVYDHSLVIPNDQAQDATSQKYVKDQDFSQMKPDAVGRDWHCPSIEFPAIHIPGTQWHKYFGNLDRDDVGPRAAIFDEDFKRNVRVSFPEVAVRIEQEMRQGFAEFEGYFLRSGRLPFPRKLLQQKATYLDFLMEHLDIGDHERVLLADEASLENPHEGLCQDFRPDRDAYGNERFEKLNLILNEPELSGPALRGEDIAAVVQFHVVEAQEYAPSDSYEEWEDSDDD